MTIPEVTPCLKLHTAVHRTFNTGRMSGSVGAAVFPVYKTKAMLQSSPSGPACQAVHDVSYRVRVLRDTEEGGPGDHGPRRPRLRHVQQAEAGQEGGGEGGEEGGEGAEEEGEADCQPRVCGGLGHRGRVGAV